MPELAIEVLRSEPARYAVTPTLLFRVCIRTGAAQPVHAMVLKSQVRIEPQRRRYRPDEEEGLVELFGEPARRADTRKPFFWAELSTIVPSFLGQVEVEMAMACSYDLEVAGHRYLHALREGDVPLSFLFSGTVFYMEDGRMSLSPVPWNLEATYRLPVAQWREVMDGWFPGGGWLRLQRETIDALGRIKTAEALPTWDQAVNVLLKRAGAE